MAHGDKAPPSQRQKESDVIEVGDWIRTTGGLRGRVIGEGTLTTRDWPAWKIDIGDGRVTAILKEDVELWAKGE